MAIGKKTGGRRKGIPNRASIARQKKIAEEGKMPLDVMIENMRFADSQAAEILAKVTGERDGSKALEGMKEVLRLRAIAQECAKDAAPYVHPKLSAVDQKTTALKPDGSAAEPVIHLNFITPAPRPDDDDSPQSTPPAAGLEARTN